jgi:pimeloyl-ACP methyl ester carboxylesterase
MAIFEFDAGRIFYEEHGSGDPPLMFVHGLACSQEDWRNQIDYFAPSNRVVSLDLRGHGRSEGYTLGFDIVSFGADVAALIAELRLPPVLLVGHSMGCRVVLECARIAPQHVTGLVLIDGSRFAATSADAARRAVQRAIQTSGYDTFLERLFTQMFTADSNAQTRDAIVARAKQLPRSAGLELVPQMAAWDADMVERALRSVKVPLSVFQSTHLDENRERISLRPGDRSPWLELVKEHVPHAEIDILPGIGHFTMIEAADEVNRRLAAMLDNLASR